MASKSDPTNGNQHQEPRDHSKVYKTVFCPSPWMHMRINNTGSFEYCRWAQKNDRNSGGNIKNMTAQHYFQQEMSNIRRAMLLGSEISGCQDCMIMEQHGKVSGRQRQLLKIGATVQDFEKSMLSSPWMSEFKSSYQNHGITTQLPQDWQIDLGNFCNSACVFCSPHSSSRLAAEFKRLDLISSIPPRAWCDDPRLLDKFIEALLDSPKLAYLHFIGGETLITPAFRVILESLIAHDLAHTVSVGFTTNLTTWDQDIIDLLQKFKQVNLGMSIECLHPLNDYVRYGGEFKQTVRLLDQWRHVAQKLDWLIQLRITPTALSIWHLDTVYEYAYESGIAVESCNFLHEPAHLRPSVLPLQIRAQVLEKLQAVKSRMSAAAQHHIVNTRDPNIASVQILQDLQSYTHYLEHAPDESHRLPDMVRFIKTLERSRANCILDYLPEYEEILRSAGY